MINIKTLSHRQMFPATNLARLPDLPRNVDMTAIGPRLPTWALRQVGGYPGYTGHDADDGMKAVLGPGCVKTCLDEIPRKLFSLFCFHRGCRERR